MKSSNLVRGSLLPVAAVLMLALPPPAQATVTILNCGNAGSDFGTNCSLQELHDGGTITINGTEFREFNVAQSHFLGSTNLGPSSAIRVDPIDSKSRPGLSFTDTGTTWDFNGLVVAQDKIKFRIKRPAGALIGGRSLYAAFGNISFFNLPQGEDSSINIHDRIIEYNGSPIAHNDATVQCLASEQTCANTTRRDYDAAQPHRPGVVPWLDAQAELDVNLTAETTGHAELKSFVYLLELPYLATHLVVPDVNANGGPEIVVIQQGSITAEMRDGRTGALLSTLSFLDDTYTPVDFAVLPDLDGNGFPELAVLARESNTQAVVEIRNLGGAQMRRQIYCATNNYAKSMKVVNGDADGNGIPELAVLSTASLPPPQQSNGQEIVDVFNAFGAKNSNKLVYALNLQVLEITTLDDADGNGVEEVAALVGDTISGRYLLDIRNAAGPSGRRTIFLPAQHFPFAATNLASIGDADNDGVPEVAVLLIEQGSFVVKVRVVNASGPPNNNTILYGAIQSQQGAIIDLLGFVSLPDADGDTVPEIALLLDREINAQLTVDVRNARGTQNRRTLLFPWAYSWSPRSLASLGDVDGNGTPEVSVLLMPAFPGSPNPSKPVVQARNASGVALPHTTSFTP